MDVIFAAVGKIFWESPLLFLFFIQVETVGSVGFPKIFGCDSCGFSLGISTNPFRIQNKELPVQYSINSQLDSNNDKISVISNFCTSSY